MDPLGAFNATWSAAKSSFGTGAPQDGQPYLNGSSAVGHAQGTLDSAQPTLWTGGAAESYGVANAEQRQKIGVFAELDKQVAGRINQSAEVVSTGRVSLESVKAWVDGLAAKAPAGSAGDQFRLQLAQSGISQVATIVNNSKVKLDSIGDELERLSKEYAIFWWEPTPETDEERQKREEEESRKKLDDILKDYQVAEESDKVKVSDWLPDWLAGRLPAKYRDMELRRSEIQLLANLGPFDMIDAFKIKDQAEEEAKRRFPPPSGDDDNTSDNHTDAFRHAYWNALMTQRFGQEWTEKFATAHERRPDPAVRKAMDLHNNEIGRRIALDNPNASPDELAALAEEAVRKGDTVVVNTESTGVEWSNKIPVGAECGHPPNDTPPYTGPTPYPTEGRTP